MKYVKKIAAIFCAVMMVVTINASVVNAASTDEGNPSYYAYFGKYHVR